MSLKVFNTLSGEKEDFKPINQGKVGMYVCGVTVYDRCHLGHARAAVAFDFIYRSFLKLGYEVTYVRNFTDVDDKIIERAGKRGISCDELVEENIKAFYEDMDAMGISRPTHEPYATKYIPQMINLIEELIKKGHAYESGGDVFFSISSFKEYGRLSGKKIEDLRDGARVDINEDKKEAIDFALWKSAKPGEPKWDSPWGEGRPGWHIECSAMAKNILGDVFDIHGGGKDLVFPHHENEIAQSQGATGKPPVNYWMHNGFVNINKEKMSKSLDNFFTIKDITNKFEPEAVRLYLLSTHYRSPIDFADPYLLEAEKSLDYFYETASRAEILLSGDRGNTEEPSEFADDLKTAIEDDFNSAVVVALFNKTAGFVNSACDNYKKKNGGSLLKVQTHYNFFRELATLLGIVERDPSEYLKTKKIKRTASTGMSAKEIEEAIKERTTARADRDFAKSDEIRDMLASKGIEIKDLATGTHWSVKAK